MSSDQGNMGKGNRHQCEGEKRTEEREEKERLGEGTQMPRKNGKQVQANFPVLVLSLSSPCPVLVLYLLCPCPVLVLSLPCSCPALVLSLSCSCPCPCPCLVLVLSLSCSCHCLVLVLSLSWTHRKESTM